MRQIKERVDPTNAAVRDSAPVGAAITARPSGPQSAPTVYDPGMDIARSLQSLNPALTKFLGEGVKEEQERQRMLGQRARAMQEDDGVVPMTREQNPEWQRGYMEMHGRMMGIKDSTEIEQFYQDNKNTLSPEQFEEFLAKQRGSRLEGFEDEDALKLYLPALMQTENKLRDDYARVQVAKVRQQTVEYVNVEIGAHLRAAKEMSIEDAVAERERIREIARTRGVTSPEFTAMYVQALVSDPNTGPADLQVLYTPGPDGVAPVDANGPDGRPMRDAIERAMESAVTRMNKELQERQREYAVGVHNWLGNLLAKDDVLDANDGPLAIQDPESFVYSLSYKGGPFDGPGQAAEAIKRIRAAQDDQREALHIDSYFRAWGFVPAALKDTKQGKKLVQRQFENVWAGMDMRNEADVQQRMQKSLRLMEQLGNADPFLKSVGEVAHQYGTVEVDGKEVLSPELKTALAIFRGIRGSNNPTQADAIFNDKSTAFLSVLDSAAKLMPEKDAYDMAKRVAAEGPDVKRQMWTPQERGAAVKTASDQFENWFFNQGNGVMPTVLNKEFIGNQIIKQAENLYVAARGALTKDQAIEQAQRQVIGAHAYDGVQTMFPIPADHSREQAKRIFPFLVQEAKAAYKAKTNLELDNYLIQMAQVEGKPMWVVTDTLGRAITKGHRWGDVEDLWRKGEKLTFEDVAADHRSVSSNPLGGERAALIDAYGSGRISAAEFEKRDRALAKQRRDVAVAKAQAVLARRNQVPKLPAPDLTDVPLRIRTPQPVGPEMNTKQMALTHFKAHPEFALTVAGEGFRNTVYRDSGGTRAIGLGYNIDARGGDEVARKDFAKIGIVDPERQTRILQGKEAITADEGVRLYEVIKKEYVARAKKGVGDETWNALLPHQRAVLTDMTYQMGQPTFLKVWDRLKGGDARGATEILAAAMKERGSGAKRRMALRLALWESPDKFQQLIEQGI